MSLEALLERLHLLQSQARWAESRTLLETYLADDPDQPVARLYYVNTLVNMGEKERARELVEPLLEEHPDEPMVLRLAAIIELNDGKALVAERFAIQLMEMNAEDDDAYVLMAKAKLDQRNYDAALRYLDEALALDPENTEALNMKIYVGGFLGKADTANTIAEALNLNPEDSSTIANHGYQLLREGKVDEALERLHYALSLNPTDQLARFALLEALKARFWPYRLYFKYKEGMAKLSGGVTMGIVIGSWFAVNGLNRYATNNPEVAPYVLPIVYLMVALFLLTWIIDPIMNFYLLTNKYGRLLLDKDDTLMAKLVGSSLGLAVLSFVAYFTSGGESMLLCGIIFVAMTIPLGSFLNPILARKRSLLVAYTIGLAVFAFGGVALNSGWMLNLAGLGLLAYQFLLNGLVAREGARTFGE
jgi:tetratricopeptide (TPR) repeat protein